MRISDWSSDVCSSDLPRQSDDGQGQGHGGALVQGRHARTSYDLSFQPVRKIHHTASRHSTRKPRIAATLIATFRSEEHTSELQSLMRISYALFCLKKKKNKTDEDLRISKNSADNNETTEEK